MSKPQVIVGVSGGVDSAVALALLKQQGYSVEGVFMTNWHAEPDDRYCTWRQDLADAQAVCKHLNVPFRQVDFADHYWNDVFQDCLRQLALGNTPNPDVFCNSVIKFELFRHYAKELGAEMIATGHYARKTCYRGTYRLLKAKDDLKDQSYFLQRLNQTQLKDALFPLGNLTKNVVRQKARELGLTVSDKPDSTGICFIGERKFREFLQHYLLTRPGEIVNQEGQVLGQHQGVSFYTIGQRKGLGIGGKRDKLEAPWYVLKKDLTSNRLVVTQDPATLLKNELVASDISWIGKAPKDFPVKCQAKIRYRQADQECILLKADSHPEQLLVKFKNDQRAVTPGQAIAFYQGECCLGGGTIIY